MKFAMKVSLLALLGLVVFGLFTPQGDSVLRFMIGNSGQEKTGQKHDKRVTWYLQEVDEKQRVERSKMAIENRHYAPEVESVTLTSKKSILEDPRLEFGVAMDQDIEAAIIHGQISTPSLFVDETPEDRINRMLLDQQLAEQDQQEADEEYIRQFKENAARAGYKVKIDNQLRVKDVKKLRKYKPIN